MKKYISLLALWIIFIFPTQIHAKPVTLAYVDFPPYEYEKDGQPEGVLVEIVKTIFKRADVPVQFVYYPFKRALEETKEGVITGLFNFYKTDERLANFDYSDPIISNPLVLFVSKKNPLEFHGDLYELKGKKIGAMLGYTYGVEFDYTKLFTIDRANSHESNFKKLVSQRIDAYPCDKLVGLYVLSKENLMKDVDYLQEPLKIMEGHIGFTKGRHTELIHKINQVIRDMKKNNEIEIIIQNYVASLNLSSLD